MITQGEFIRRFRLVEEFVVEQMRLGNLAQAITREAGCCEFGDKFLDSYIKLLADYMGGDKDGWIEWYIWENDMGKQRMEAGYVGKSSRISNPKQLYKLIKQGQERK